MKTKSLVSALIFMMIPMTLAACGDDDPVTTGGTGGDGGSAGAGGMGTSSSSSSSSSTTTSSSSSSSGAVLAPIGDHCAADKDCESGTCLTETNTGWPSGYCTSPCNGPNDCTGDTLCVSINQAGDSYCLATCLGNGDCSDGNACYTVSQNGDSACAPGCSKNSECTELDKCNVDAGLCVNAEVCDDNKDNDLDGAVDCQDAECAMLQTCADAINAACMNAPVLVTGDNMGDTTGDKNLFAGSCTGSGSPEDVFTFTAPDKGKLVLDFDSGMADMGIYVRTACNDAGSELGCVNDFGADHLELVVNMGDTLFIYADGYAAATDVGPYTLKMNFIPAAPEVCDDGQDNDFDNSIDCDDTDCTMTCEPLITAACTAAPVAQPSNMGDTAMGTNLFSGSCTGDAAAKENVYSFTAPGNGDLKLSLDSMTDQGIYIRSKCEDAMSQTACVDDQVGGAVETLSVALTSGQQIFIYVDGYNGPADAGPYTLNANFVPQVCGDNVLSSPEQCDDGNMDANDGCDAMCAFLPQNEKEPNNDKMTTDQPFEGKVTAAITANDNDWFKVVVPGPMSVISATTGPAGNEVCMSQNGAVGTIDTEIQILAADGMTELAFNEDINGSTGAAGNYCSTATVTGLAAGTYFVRVGPSQAFCAACTFAYSVVLSVE